MNQSFSDGIILIMKSVVPKRSALMMRSLLRYQRAGHGHAFRRLAFSVVVKTPSMSNPQFWNGNVPWVTSKDMKRPVITDSEMHISELAAATMQLYPAGTLLLVARSGILKRLLPLCKLGIDSTINQDIKAFSLYDIELSEWLFYGIKAFEPFILKELVKSVTTVESLNLMSLRLCSFLYRHCPNRDEL